MHSFHVKRFNAFPLAIKRKAQKVQFFRNFKFQFSLCDVKRFKKTHGNKVFNL